MKKVLISLMLGWMISGAAVAGSDPSSEVVIFSATYCPACVHVKQFLKREGIAYVEFDIETSVAARETFDRLGGRGTPLIYVKNQRMEGFDEARFWRLYGKKPEDG